MKPNRILLVSTTMGLGGADKQVSLLSRRLQSRGYETKVVALRPLGEMGENLRRDGVSVNSLNLGSTFEGAKAILRLRKEIKQFEPDIIHSHMFHANILSRITRVIAPSRTIISTIHNVYESHPEKGITWREKADKYTDPLSDLTTTVSKIGTKRYVDLGLIPEQKSKTVYNGIDTDSFGSSNCSRDGIRRECAASDKFVWLAVGRFFPQKDYSNMLAAVDRIDDGHLWIIGHGEERDEIERDIKNRGIVDKVDILGTVPQVEDYMKAADAYLLSSKWEGFPMVIIEAMACNLPVVATRAGGTPEAVVDGKTGFLAPTESPERLSESMEKMMHLGKAERDRMGEAGRERVKNNFEISIIVDEWESIYQEYFCERRMRTADWGI